MKYFSKEEVNTGRQPELDFYKALCIIGMIFSHVFLDLVAYAEEPGAAASFQDYLVSLVGASGFMVCMGIGMRYSKHQGTAMYTMRGAVLLTVGQLLNLLRNAAPNLIAYWITGKQFFIANALLVIQADILTFAGLTFLLMALFKKFRLKGGTVFAAGLVMNVLSAFLYYHVSPPSSFLASQFAGFFVITDAESYFPLFCYFIFVAFGHLVGTLYPRIRDKDGLSARILLIGAPVCAAYYALRILVPIPGLPNITTNLQYVMQPGPDVLAACLLSLVFIALLYRILKLMHGKLPKVLAHFSLHINAYYCISYLMILPLQTILIAALGRLPDSMLFAAIYTVVVLVACYVIIELNEKYWHIGFAKLRGRKLMILTAVIWILTVATVVYVYPKVSEYATIWNDYLLPK